MRRQVDENLRPDRPLDDTGAVSATDRGRNGRRRIRRASILVAAIVCGLVGPTTARAADPFGADQLVQQIDAAVATATGPASPQASSPASAPLDAASSAAAAATKTVEAATTQAAAVASTAAASAQQQIQSTAATSESTAPALPSASTPAARSRKVPQGHTRNRGRRATRSESSPRVPSTIFTSTENRVAQVPTKSWPSASSKRAEHDGSSGARETRETKAGPMPQRPLPSPSPQGPGMAPSGPGGAHGPLTPLVVGALAAVLLMFGFELLPRALPLLAFRKPGHLPLPPWHPG
jgi:hypothetical protein